MKLYELAFACYCFSEFEKGYQDAYKDFLEETKHKFDMSNESHRGTLLTWLNRWRCHIPGDSFREISEHLRLWFENSAEVLPQTNKQLLDLSDEEIDRASEAYGQLIGVGGTKIDFIAETIASKILFALRKDVYPIWDKSMRDEYRKQRPFRYSDYMKFCKNELSALQKECAQNRFTIDQLPLKLKREKESLLKLLDEYHWVTMTRGVVVPTPETFRAWLEWV
jgi:hypothetical protein